MLDIGEVFQSIGFACLVTRYDSVNHKRELVDVSRVVQEALTPEEVLMHGVFQGSLNQISEFLQERHSNMHFLIYVIDEGGLEGKIYRWNNYGDNTWDEWASTRGYA